MRRWLCWLLGHDPLLSSFAWVQRVPLYAHRYTCRHCGAEYRP